MSEHNGHQSSWEEWQLTAYVLGEVDPDLAQRIEAAAEDDAQLSAEIAALDMTVGRIRHALELEPEAFESSESSEERLARIFEQAARSTTHETGDNADSSSATVQLRTRSAGRRLRLSLLATVACLFVAIYLAVDHLPLRELAQRAPANATVPVTELESSSSREAAFQNEDRAVISEQLLAETEPASTSTPPKSGADESRLARLAKGQSGAQPARTVASEDFESKTNLSSLDAAKPVPADLQDHLSVEQIVPVADQDALAAAPTTNQRGAVAAIASDGELSKQLLGDQASRGMGLVQQTEEEVQLLRRTANANGMGAASGQESRQLSRLETVQKLFAFRSREQGFVDNQDHYFEAEKPEAAGRDRYESLSLAQRASGDRFAAIHENDFASVTQAPLSTFSIDVDTASYAKTRQWLLEANRLPPAGAVRIEEFVNYFDYGYAGPTDGETPFSAHLAVASCPWQPQHQLVRIALQATKLDLEERPKANIVFLLDVSGSMDEPNKLPLVKNAMRMLTKQLGENDRVAMVVYAGAAGCVLEGTRGDKRKKILGALDRLNAGGSTNGGQGIQLAYDLARDNFIPDGINRVILCTDGDFNVGVTKTDSLVDLVAENAKSKIFLTVLGFGMGNSNDAMMEQISNRGNGVYGFVDSQREAHRQMVKQLAGNLVTVAKDVKIQVEFNPARVRSYRLLGYENRMLAAKDFNDDTKDAGEIGAGHRVTALYEVVPVSAEESHPAPDGTQLRYQSANAAPAPQPADTSDVADELLAVNLRYKQPEGDVSQLLTFPLKDRPVAFTDADRDFRWAASVVEFGLLLRNSQFRGDANWETLVEHAVEAAGHTPTAERQECLEMMRRAATLAL